MAHRFNCKIITLNHPSYVFSSNLAEFPVFTICPQYEQGYKKSIIEEKYNSTVKDVRKLNYPNVSNTREFFNEVTYNLTDFIKSVRFIVRDKSVFNSWHLTLNINKNGIGASNGKNFKHEDFFENINWISFGQCHTLEANTNLKMSTVFEIK